MKMEVTEKIDVNDINIPEVENETGHMVMPSKKHYPDKNSFVAEGVLVHRFDTNSISMLTVKTLTGRNRSEESYINIIVFQRVKGQLEDIKQGDHIRVEGHLRTRKTKEGTYQLSVVAESVEKSISKMEEAFGLTGRIHEAGYNKILLAGEIMKNNMVSRGVFKLTLRISNEGKRTYVDCTLFAKNSKAIVDQVLVGNRICAIGEVQAYKKEREGEKPIFIQEAILLDIQEV